MSNNRYCTYKMDCVVYFIQFVDFNLNWHLEKSCSTNFTPRVKLFIYKYCFIYFYFFMFLSGLRRQATHLSQQWTRCSPPISPSCQLLSWLPHPAPGTMASSEEDGTVEEKENNNKKRTKSALATAWLTFYNIAMTAGYVSSVFPPLWPGIERRLRGDRRQPLTVSVCCCL